MKIIIKLSMDFPEIYRYENMKLFSSEGVIFKEVFYDPPIQIFEVLNYDSPRLLQSIRYIVSRSTSIKRCLLVPNSLHDFLVEIRDFFNYGSFAVHVHRESSTIRYDRNKDIDELVKLMRSVGYDEVSLKNPDIILAKLYCEDRNYTGVELYPNKRRFVDRRPSKRPIFSPFSLEPKLARLLINLSGVPRNGIVIDPFCGVGGVPIEAAYIDVNSICVELKYKWARGAIRNIEYFLSGPQRCFYEIISGDSLDAFINVESMYLATDPPYGRITSVSSIVDEVYRYLVSSFLRKVRGAAFFTDRDIGDILADYRLSHIVRFTIPVHSSLTRFLYVTGV